MMQRGAVEKNLSAPLNVKEEMTTMTSRKCIRQAISVLMMSPFYFRLDLAARQQLIKEFCQAYFAEPVR